ncbi:MAG: response regulator [Myxococcota bacterium]
MAYAEGLNILVVDPEESVVLEYKELLGDAGHHVQATTEVALVVEEVKNGRFPLVVLDVSPPVEERLELLAKLRAADSDVCVITTTAAPDATTAVRVLKLGALDYLSKPVAPEELQHVVEQAIREKGLLVDLETRLNQVLGERLRSLRNSLGLTLKQVANRTGLSVSLISQIELGKSAASLSTLHKLSTALQVKLTYFFETL